MFRLTATRLTTDHRCSYDPAKGGSATVVLERYIAHRVLPDSVAHELTGRGQFQQSHSSTGLTGGGARWILHDPRGGRWDCFRIDVVPVDTETGRVHGPTRADAPAGPGAIAHATTILAETLREELNLSVETACDRAEACRDALQRDPSTGSASVLAALQALTIAIREETR